MTIAPMKLLVWLLAALASLVFVLVLLLLFSVATIRRWRIVAPRIVLCTDTQMQTLAWTLIADARRAPDAYCAERVAAAGELARTETFAQRTDEAISLWQEALTADADAGIQKVEGYVRLANLLRARGQRDDGVNTLRAMARVPWKPHFQADAMRAAYIGVGLVGS